ncbi:80_t:CDS:1, partial [Acaulospora morrowiae]
ILNYLKDAYFYYYNMTSQGYKSLIVVFIDGICGDFHCGGLVGDSQFRRIYLIIKYGGEKTKLVVKNNHRVGRTIKVKDEESEEEFEDQPKKKVYERSTLAQIVS